MNRDKAIDLLKFLAVVFVVNSHMDICYPDAYKSLATGGSLGDALFFFCSGYTLFLGKNLEFLCWYKRRLARILPSVIVCVLGYSCIYGEGWYTAVGGYWFVRCIFLYYVVIYFVRRYLSERMWLAFTCVGVIVCAWWLLFENPRHSIYGGGYFMWGHYFIQMMLGAVVGKCRDSIRSMPWFDIPCLIGLITMYFGLWKFAMRTIGFEWIQLVTIPLLSLIIYFFYKIAKSSFSSRLTKGGGYVVMAVGGLCLEVYLSHRVFLSDSLNHMFPLNIPVLMAAAVVLAYIVRCISRFMVQTLRADESYDFRAIVKL